MNFKMIILDYAKIQLDNPISQRLLNDIITIKQKNFERTDPNYVVLDKHDMISTHFLIYDTTNIFSPRLIFALRMTYEDRASKHKIKTPLQDLIPHLSEECKIAYENFHLSHPVLADCNSWFVEPAFSLKESGLRLSDIGYAMVYLQAKRMGFNHIAGCTNEKYKASRWLENIGSFKKGMTFIHPIVPDPHMLVLIEKFNEAYIKSIYDQYQALFDQIYEVIPAELKYKNIQQTISEFFRNHDPAAATNLDSKMAS